DFYNKSIYTKTTSTKKAAIEDANSRRWKVGFAAVAGAALIGVTGGLAAPLFAAGVGTVMGGLGIGIPLIGGYLGALAGSSVLISGLFGAYGGKMTGRMMHQYAREVKDFSFVPTQASISDGSTQIRAPNGGDGMANEADTKPSMSEAEQSRHKLRVAIGITGWLMDESEITSPWCVFRSSSIEAFALRWETSTLLRLGTSLNAVLKSYIWSAAKFELAKLTIFGILIAGLWPLGLLQVARVLDNPFSVAKSRSDEAGRVLAEVLMQKVQGERPVVLVGYSLGARVIYQCLLALAEQNAFGLVESVIMIGAPTPRMSATGDEYVPWSLGGSDDYILGFLYRTSSFQFGVAGLEPVQGVAHIENVDITNLMGKRGHATYKALIGRVLQEIGFEDVDLIEVEKEEEALRRSEENERQKNEEVQAQGDSEVAELMAIIDEENAIVRDKMRKQTAPKVPEKEVLMTPDASDSELDNDDGKIAMLDLEDDLPRTSDKYPPSVQATPLMAPSNATDFDATEVRGSPSARITGIAMVVVFSSMIVVALGSILMYYYTRLLDKPLSWIGLGRRAREKRFLMQTTNLHELDRQNQGTAQAFFPTPGHRRVHFERNTMDSF
ncbi:MAG: hypothetical protein Q9226_005074, partial [Calogaya cf. arnoldii]